MSFEVPKEAGPSGEYIAEGLRIRKWVHWMVVPDGFTICGNVIVKPVGMSGD